MWYILILIVGIVFAFIRDDAMTPSLFSRLKISWLLMLAAIPPALRLTMPMTNHQQAASSNARQDVLRLPRMVAAGLVLAAAWMGGELYTLRRVQARLKNISKQVLDAQEAERRHIARELHDEIGQALTALKVNLQTVQRLSDSPTLETSLQESLAIIDRTLQQVRALSLDLRPSLLDDLGVVSAIRWYLDRQARRAGFQAQFVADPPEMRLPPDLETTCFRIVQEAVTNVVRHARANNVEVEMRQEDEHIDLVIRDDGVGFDVRAALSRKVNDPSLGLVGMEERVQLMGGFLVVHSDTPRSPGTEIFARLPLDPKNQLSAPRRRRGGDL